MSCGLTKGRNEPCSDSVGGIRKVYLFSFVKYADSQIQGTKGVVLTSFPSTTIYDFWVQNATFNEDINNDENGVFYSQNLSFTLKKQDVNTTRNLNIASKGELRFIVEYNDGGYKIGGLFNGAEINNIELNSGGNKADGSLYNVSITGQELHQSAFIDDLSSAGFTIGQWLTTESGDDLVTQDYYNIIIE